MTTATTTDTLVYRFEGSLGELCPLGVFPEGLRFHNGFAATVTDGPFAGGRIFGLDQFTLRPDGVGVIVAPEVIECGDVRVAVDVRGYVLAPEGVEVPPLDVVASPGFAFPDVDFRMIGTAMLQTTHEELAWLNRAVAVLEGTVNMGTGRLEIEARAV